MSSRKRILRCTSSQNVKRRKDDDTYAKAGLANTLHGVSYQHKWLMWFSLSKPESANKLATEWTDAGKFDDLVYMYEDNIDLIYRFMQIKHRQERRDKEVNISVSDLLNITDGDFSLLKYFQSYCDITENDLYKGEKCRDFIICTNIGFKYGDCKNKFTLSKEIFDVEQNEDEILKTKLHFFKKKFSGKEQLMEIFKLSSDFYKLSEDLVNCVWSKTNRGSLNFDTLVSYRGPLAKEIIDVDKKRFKSDFVKGKNLSIEASDFRTEFLDRIELRKAYPKLNSDKNINLKDLAGIFSSEILKNKVVDFRNLNAKQFSGVLKSIAGYLFEKIDGDCKLCDTFLICDDWMPKHIQDFKQELEEALGTKKNADYSDVKFLFRENIYKLVFPNFLKGAIHLPVGFGKDDDEMKDLPKCDFNSSKADEFLSLLRFAVDQPNEEDLSKMLISKINQVFNLSQSEIPYCVYYEKMLNWFKEKEGRFLTNENYQSMIEFIKQELCCFELIGISKNYRNLLKNDMSPEVETFLKIKHFLKNEKKILILKNDVCLKLSSIKVNQVLANFEEYKSDDSVIFVNQFPDRSYLEKIIELFPAHFKLLVVECESDEINYFLRKIMFNMQKKIILITLKDFSQNLLEIIEKSSLNKDEHFDKDNYFRNFIPTTRATFLSKKIEFQGMPVQFQNIVSHISNHYLLDKMLNLEIIKKFVSDEPISIGHKLADLGQVDKFYVSRKLSRKIVLSEECLKDNSSIFVLKCNADNSYLSKFESYKNVLNDESDLETTCGQRSEKTVHWLELIQINGDNHLIIWKRSNKAIDNLREYLKSFIEIDQPNDLFVLDDKIAIISADPGMGKTTILTHLAINTKEKNKEKWVIRVNLNEHTDLLCGRRFNDLQSAKSFLLTALNLNNDFDAELFSSYFTVPNKLIVVFDGLDEVAPTYHEKVLSMVKLLIEQNVLVRLTTRPFLKRKVEDLFCTFAYELVPFDRSDQREFLRKYWKEVSNSEPNIKFVEELINLMSNSLKDNEKSFLGVPLQTQMIAELYQEEAKSSNLKNLPQKINLLEMFQKFFRIKFDRYCIEKKRQDNTNVPSRIDNKKDFKSQRKNLQTMSLFNLYESDKICQLLSPSSFKKAIKLMDEINKGNNKLGIIVEIKNKKPIFIHRTFVECFAADYFSTKCNKREINAFLIENLFRQENQVIRHFFDRMIIKTNSFVYSVKVEQSDSDDANVSKVKEESRELFFNLVLNGESDLIDNFKDHFFDWDSGGRTALHLSAALGHTKICKQLIGETKSESNFINKKDSIFSWSPLRYADNEERWETANLLLENGADEKDMTNLLKIVNSVNDRSDTLLHLAAERGFYHIAEIIIDQKPDLVNAKNKDHFGKTPLHIAAMSGHLNIVNLFISKEANVMSEDFRKNTSLHEAAAADHERVLHRLLQLKNINIECKNNFQQTPLYFAAQNGCLATAKLLLIKYKAQVNVLSDTSPSLDAYNWTPLHVSAYHGYDDIVNLLLANGADQNAKDNLGRSPLDLTMIGGYKRSKLLVMNALGGTELHRFHLAVGGGDIEAVKQMLENRSNEEVGGLLTTELTWTALHKAAHDGQIEALKFILAKGVGVNIRASDGITPLHAACYGGHAQVANILIDNYNADIRAVNNDDWSILHAAAQHGELEIFKLVEKKLGENFDIHIIDPKHSTPLHTAAFHNRLEMVKYLIKRKADINRCDKYGATPLMQSFVRNNTKIAKYFLNQPNISLTLKNGTFLGDVCISGMHLVAAYDNIELMRILVENHGSDVNEGRGIGVTPLHFAAIFDSNKVIKYLIDNGADKTATVNCYNLGKQTIGLLKQLPPFLGAFDMLRAQAICRAISFNPLPIDAYIFTSLIGYDNKLLQRHESPFSKSWRYLFTKMVDFKEYAEKAKFVIEEYK